MFEVEVLRQFVVEGVLEVVVAGVDEEADVADLGGESVGGGGGCGGGVAVGGGWGGGEGVVVDGFFALGGGGG